MDNIFYFRKINKIGGTEQFLYEIAKKYHKYDITIFYDEADIFQLMRLKKYLRCKKRIKGELVKCKKAFFNFNIDMIDDVEAEEYIFVSHANYEELGYKPPIEHPKLTGFVGVSQFATDKLNEYGKKLGLNIDTRKCYNPLTLEPVQKVPIIVSACRLDDQVKGGERTIQLINALDRYCEEKNRQYLWLIFTNKTTIKLPSPNAIYMQPRVDVRPYIARADWVAQLSNDMETYCYTTNESTGYGVPIITTPLSVYNELPVTDNERIVLNWDCSNVDEVARLIFEKEVKPFKYKIPEDDWENILVKGKNMYEEEKKMKVKVECVFDYYDLELNTLVTPNDDDKNKFRVTTNERAEEIIEKTNGAIKILGPVEEKKEKAVKPSKKKEKAVK
jgi:hypothetical protein